MIENARDLAAGAAALFMTLWLSVLSWIGRREVRRIDGKADVEQLNRLITLMEKRDDQYREDQKEVSQGRRELHQKVEAVVEKLNETNVQLARLAGRMNGSYK